MVSGVCPVTGDLPLLNVALPLLLDVLGMGSANSSSQSSAGNGNEMGVLGGSFGFGGTFGLPLGVALG